MSNRITSLLLSGIACMVFFKTETVVANLVLKPKQSFIITHPAKPLPVEKTAAQELAAYLKKSLGIKALILPESKLKSKNAANAYIGQCAFTKEQSFYSPKLRQEEFQITIEGGKLFIYGDDEAGNPFSTRKRTGTLFGIYDFLEKELGITWIWPSESGEDIPKHKQLILKPFSRKDYPRYIIRSMLFSYMKWEPEKVGKDIEIWAKRMKLSWIPKAWFGHSWHYYMHKFGMNKKHPEWLALWKGKRQMPHCCTSNKEFRDYIVEQCLINSASKGNSIVSISPSDGYGFCECAECRALDSEDTNYEKGSSPNLSNRHWAYANYIAREVKKKNPKLGVGMFAYTAYREPPTNIAKMEDNVYLSFTFSKAYFVKPEEKKKYFELIDRWSQKGVKIIGREYWGMHYWLSLPFIFTKQIKEAMPYLYKRGLIAMYGEAEKDFATQGPNYYLVAHLMWNPEADADKIMKRYYKAFGPAAKAIKNYYDTFEQSILQNQEKIEGFGYHKLINSWPEIFPVQTIVEAAKCIKEAEKAAAKDKVYEERIKLVKIGFEYTKVMVELLGIYRRLGRAGVPLWFFGYEGDAAAVRKHKLPKMPDNWKKFWDKHPPQPISRAEKIKLLKRALFLGNERVRILDKYAELPAVSRGLYYYTVHAKIRPWHQAIVDELQKEKQNDK